MEKLRTNINSKNIYMRILKYNNTCDILLQLC